MKIVLIDKNNVTLAEWDIGSPKDGDEFKGIYMKDFIEIEKEAEKFWKEGKR